MASVKSQGSTSNGRDSNGQRLGVKALGGERVTIVKTHNPFAVNDLAFAKITGVVKFEFRRGTLGRAGGRRRVSVYPVAA